MKFSIRFLALLPLLGLAGCAQLPTSNQSTALATSSSTAQKINLEPNLMFELLVGEMLVQKGDLVSAYNLLFPIAEKTRDLGLTERTFHLAMSANFLEGVEQSAALWREIEPEQASPWRVGYLMSLRNQELEQALHYWQEYRQRSEFSLGDDLKNAAAQAAQSTTAEIGIAFFQRLVEIYPKDWAAGYALGYVADHYGQADLAIEALELVVKKHKAPPEVYYALANLYVENDYTERGLEQLNKYVNAHPQEWMMQERYARLEVKALRYLSAKKRYSGIVEANPRAFTSKLSLALLQLELNETDEAKALLTSLVAVEGYQDVSHYYLGVIAQSSQQYDQALEHLTQVSHPNYYLDANILIAQIFVTTRGLEIGIDHLEQLQPSNEDELIKVLRAQGIFYTQSGIWDRAAEYYRAAIALSPGNLPISFSLAMALYELQEFEEYEILVKDLVLRYPDEPDALNALAYYYVEQNIKLDEAERLLDRALEIAPDRFHIIDSRGWLEYQRGNYQEAERILQRAWSLRQDEEVLIHLIKAQWAQGKKQQAEALWKEFYQDYPDNEVLPGLIDKLREKVN